ncbi:hypothetical protein BC828DRAFT_409871 [Blastocladiella britannica]|nr:hypothetical protein BC828DRAFT_409871 [Blastocladiella britannica]
MGVGIDGRNVAFMIRPSHRSNDLLSLGAAKNQAAAFGASGGATQGKKGSEATGSHPALNSGAISSAAPGANGGGQPAASTGSRTSTPGTPAVFGSKPVAPAARGPMTPGGRPSGIAGPGVIGGRAGGGGRQATPTRTGSLPPVTSTLDAAGMAPPTPPLHPADELYTPLDPMPVAASGSLAARKGGAPTGGAGDSDLTQALVIAEIEVAAHRAVMNSTATGAAGGNGGNGGAGGSLGRVEAPLIIDETVRKIINRTVETELRVRFPHRAAGAANAANSAAVTTGGAALDDDGSDDHAGGTGGSPLVSLSESDGAPTAASPMPHSSRNKQPLQTTLSIFVEDEAEEEEEEEQVEEGVEEAEETVQE